MGRKQLVFTLGLIGAVIGGSHAPVRAAIAKSSALRQQPTIPFLFDDSRVWVPVRIGRSSTTDWFVLDTGASPNLIDSQLASSRRLVATDNGLTSGAGGGRTPTGRLGATEFHVGSVPLRSSEVITSSLEQLLASTSGRHAPGIIGSQFFIEHVVELDFDRHRMRLSDPATYRYSGRGIVVPLELNDGVPLATGSLVAADGQAFAMRLLVDLGAKSTLLIAEPFINRVGLRNAFRQSVESPLGAGMGGPTRYAFARAASVSLGGAKLDRPVVGLSVDNVLKSDWYDGLLGADFLSRYRVIFDYSRRRMMLEPRRPFVGPEPFDRSGLFVRAEGPMLDRMAIAEVRSGTPAAAAGLAAGDTILSVDGLAAASLSLGTLRQRLRGAHGKQVKLEYQRGNQTRVAQLILRDAL